MWSSFFAVAFAAFWLSGAAVSTKVAKAQTPPPAPSSPAASPAPTLSKPRTWLIDNKNGLVTVQEKNGPYLFAQVVTTPLLTVEATKTGATGRRTMTLKDATGKRLYDLTFPPLENRVFDFHYDFFQGDKGDKTGGISFTMTPATPEDAVPANKNDAKLVFVLNADDWLVHGDFVSGTQRQVFEQNGTQLTETTFENGKQTEHSIVALDLSKGTVTGTSNGKEVLFVQSNKEKDEITGRDSKGEIKSRTVKRGDKDYTELSLGDRKILLEGGWWFHMDDGDVFVTQSQDFVNPGKSTDKQPTNR